ncbi:MAG TPA: type 1 glutamine amidotransferase [Pseudonocardia sp.]|nr:type 1 glutamine amidotransferase [Pseudonocardia sp.]
MRVLFVQHQADCPPGLVGDRLVELGHRLDVVDPRSSLPDVTGYDLVVPLGSEDSAADESVPYLRAEWALLDAAIEAGVPVFGICFGAQLLCRVLGGTVGPAPGGPEVAWMTVQVDGPDPESDQVLAGPWLSWHHDALVPPPGSALAHSAAGNQTYVVGRNVGVQFHPEATAAAAAAWLAGDAATVKQLGIDPDALVAAVEDGEAAHARVAALVDWVLTRTGLATA